MTEFPGSLYTCLCACMCVCVCKRLDMASNRCRGHRPAWDTCANEAIPRQGMGGLLNHPLPANTASPKYP